MLVKELIALLRTLPQDAPVLQEQYQYGEGAKELMHVDEDLLEHLLLPQEVVVLKIV